MKACPPPHSTPSSTRRTSASLPISSQKPNPIRIQPMVAQMASSQQQQSQQALEQQSMSQDQQQLYYAQLLAAQQQAISSSNSPPENEDNELERSGASKKESDRERKEREWSERNTNLIVNYVPQNMTQEEVRALFGSMGEVESCKLIRDKASGQSLGYAFVNFERPEDAQKALISMNGLRIQNKTLKVSLARPSKDDIKGANLYVSGLPKSLTQPELEAVFRPYGAIITSRILYDNVTGLSKGVGFVRFDRKAEAEYAIEKMSGTSPWGGDEPISVKFANSPSTNSAKSSAIQMVQSLLPLQMLQSSPTAVNGTAQLSLPSLLPTLPATAQNSVAGGPIHAHTPQHRFRYSPLAGAPLISASAPIASSAAVTALSAINPSMVATTPTALAAIPTANCSQDYLSLLQQQLLQQQLVAAYAANPLANQMAAQQQYAAYAAALGVATNGTTGGMPLIGQSAGVNGMGKAKSPPINMTGWTLSVANLAPETDDPTLWKLFGPFGAVLSAKMAKGKGLGTIQMANYDEALAAIAGLNGQQLGGRTLQVSLGQTASALPSLIR